MVGDDSDGSGDEPIKYYHKGILWTRWKEIQLHLNNESISHDDDEYNFWEEYDN
jgi:hypothetical protein